MTTATKPNHIGRKISRIRELRGMKQETLAEGLNISQQAISKIEQTAEIDDDKLTEIAKILGVTKEGVENFSEESIFNNINNFNDNSINHGPLNNHHCTFNPLDKLLEASEENKKLYERLLKAEQDKVEYLEKLLNK